MVIEPTAEARSMLTNGRMGLDGSVLRIADRFLEFIHGETGCPVIVCDAEGIIVRATVRTRIGNPHAGAQSILRGERDEALVTAEDEARNPLTKEGYNCPIVVGGKRVATFGIAGPLALTRPLGRVAAQVIAGWLEDASHRQVLSRAADTVYDTLQSLVATVEGAAGSAAAVAADVSGASAEMAEQVQKADTVVSTVVRVAQQSRILSINGSVEATRAGNHGRAFAVVAKDMTRLADETKSTSALIQTSLRDIERSFARLRDVVTRSVEQSKKLGEIRESFESLREAVNTLEASFGSRSRAAREAGFRANGASGPASPSPGGIRP